MYETGDTIWHQYVEEALNKYRPDIVVISGAYTRYEGSSESSQRLFECTFAEEHPE